VTTILTRNPARPHAGIVEDMEREDNDLGPERDETDNHHRRLGEYLLRLVREADARIPAERRVPRTAAAMRARLAAASTGTEAA
jgi:hypothetical protein